MGAYWPYMYILKIGNLTDIDCFHPREQSYEWSPSGNVDGTYVTS